MYPFKNIHIVGAQSTGKKTLWNSLRTYFAESRNRPLGVRQPNAIAEIARKTITQLNINRDDVANSPEKCFQLQKAILNAQCAAESAFSGHPSRWFISDCSELDPIVYAQLYAGEAYADLLLKSSAGKAVESNIRNGLVVLCESGSSWLIDDGVRLMPRDLEEWSRTNQGFVALLNELQIDFVVVPKVLKDTNERVELVVGAHGGNSPHQRRPSVL